MNEHTSTTVAAGDHEVHLLHPATPHPGAFGISTGHPMAPAPDADADAEPGPVNYHPGPDFARCDPEAGQ
jgi:hypothetical protein